MLNNMINLQWIKCIMFSLDNYQCDALSILLTQSYHWDVCSMIFVLTSRSFANIATNQIMHFKVTPPSRGAIRFFKMQLLTVNTCIDIKLRVYTSVDFWFGLLLTILVPVTCSYSNLSQCTSQPEHEQFCIITSRLNQKSIYLYMHIKSHLTTTLSMVKVTVKECSDGCSWLILHMYHK
jgi:hypothetical protein